MRTLFGFLCAATLCSAAVQHIYLVDRTDVLGGKSFGTAGPYERIQATAYFAVDPNLPANKIIRDLEYAPRNAAGLVEFSADLEVIRPRDPKRGNGTVLVDILNRGNKTMIGTFDLARNVNDPRTPEDFGDSLLLERGFTLVWVGWQFDAPDAPGVMRVNVPLAKGVEGLVRAEFAPDARTRTMPLAERNHKAYAPADMNDRGARLVYRQSAGGTPMPIARSAWRFSDAAHATMSEDFHPGRIYELIYRSKDPAVVGLGMAAVRDLVSFLKYGGPETLLAWGNAYNKRAIGFGISQSGRFLRTFVYQGFNADEKGRKVFDGLWPHVAGAGRGSFNHRFAQPSRDGQPWANFLWPTDLPPFTDEPLLETARRQNVVPKIFYTNGSYEYWGRAASLIHETPPTAGSRIYFVAGAQHGPGSFPPKRTEAVQYEPNTNDYRYAMRGLLVAFDNWLRDGTEPPPSIYPKPGELVQRSALRFPAIPKVEVPAEPRLAYRLDFGPDFAAKGIVTIEPPKLSEPFPTLLPTVDRDGNETAGIRLPWVQVPLGTYTGWNLRAPATGAPHYMVAFAGSFFPFPVREADRKRTGDPRPAITSRYQSKDDYLARIRAAAESLAKSGYVLASDIPGMVDRSSKEWDYWLAR